MKVTFKRVAFINGIRYRKGVQDYFGDPSLLPEDARPSAEVEPAPEADGKKEGGKGKSPTDDPFSKGEKK